MSTGLTLAMAPPVARKPRSVLETNGREPRGRHQSSAVLGSSNTNEDIIKFITARKGGKVAAQHAALESRMVRKAGLAEELFDARVALKMATSHYSMYLSKEARDRLFAEFDFLLEEEAWDPEDKLPSVESYRRFLKWVVYTGDTSWSSMGIDDCGQLLVAWVRGEDLMTANFGEKVRWTQRFTADGETQQTAGAFSLDYFAKKANEFLLGR